MKVSLKVYSPSNTLCKIIMILKRLYAIMVCDLPLFLHVLNLDGVYWAKLVKYSDEK